MSVTTGKVLAKMLDEQRNLTRFYLSKLKGEDMNREFDITALQPTVRSGLLLICAGQKTVLG